MNGIIINDILYKAEQNDYPDCNNCELKKRCDQFGEKGICKIIDKSRNIIFASQGSIKKIVLIGKGGSGKDYIRKKMENQGYSYGISCTSRPKREGEIEGKDYRFLSQEKFEQLIVNGDFLQYQKFGDYYYGTLRWDWDHNNLFIMNIEGLKSLSKNDRDKAIVFYVQCDDDKIFERMKTRENLSDEKKLEKIKSRINLDNEIFKDFTDYDFIINNN